MRNPRAPAVALHAAQATAGPYLQRIASTRHSADARATEGTHTKHESQYLRILKSAPRTKHGVSDSSLNEWPPTGRGTQAVLRAQVEWACVTLSPAPQWNDEP